MRAVRSLDSNQDRNAKDAMLLTGLKYLAPKEIPASAGRERQGASGGPKRRGHIRLDDSDDDEDDSDSPAVAASDFKSMLKRQIDDYFTEVVDKKIRSRTIVKFSRGVHHKDSLKLDLLGSMKDWEVLEYWRVELNEKYPLVFKLVQIFLSLPLTSAFVERLFSTAKFMMSDSQTKMMENPEKYSAVVVTKHNTKVHKRLMEVRKRKYDEIEGDCEPEIVAAKRCKRS